MKYTINNDNASESIEAKIKSRQFNAGFIFGFFTGLIFSLLIYIAL